MNIPKELLKDQSLYSHALYFDPINQQRMLTGNGHFHFNKFDNVPGVQAFEDGSFEITYFAPGAKKVQVRGIGGSMPNTYDMSPVEEMPGYFSCVISDVCPGFHYIEFLVDGVNAIHNQLPIGYGCSYAINFVDIPDPEFEYGFLKDVPHGTIHMELYYSKITKRWRNCWVYTPPTYNQNPEKRYPVWYVQHGGGENEFGWIWQGKMNYIMDNMLAEGLCEEMIVVMNCGYSFMEDENGQFLLEKPSDVFAYDCVPMIDERYRTKAQKEYRAVSGLSFGSYHAKTTVLDHLDIFSSLGIFSGGVGYTTKNGNGGPASFSEFDYSDVFKDAETFNRNLKLLYVGYGQQEAGLVSSNAKQADEWIEKGYNVVHQTFPGYHEWNVWRRCAFNMAKLLFKW